ncbi:phosphotransferase [Nocardioides sp. Root190]|uniref:phosphotransferase family protein n=1 Tax=Nocardioides sp. Root190 TaxID=1736488 RepID=UPI0006F9AB63|nr:phosphotransferase family protein [Nocardioides sp. Root190]KRB80422.1 phosphotransferase [Nocardioides sp. Root190]
MALANTNPEEIRGALESWLGERLPGATISDCDVPAASGMSNLTILFTANGADGAELGKYVARVAPSGPSVFPGYDFEREAAVMNALASVGLPAPVVRWVELSPDVLGSPFLVMERAFGRVPGDDPPFTAAGWVLDDLSPEQRGEMCRNSLEGIAAIHSADWRALGLASLAPPAGSDATSVHDADLEHWLGFYDWARAGDTNATVEAGFAWLTKHRPVDDRDPVLLWGDARIGNMLFGEDLAVSAILDWEMVGLGQPEADIAWWLFILRHHTEGIGFPVPEGFPSREEVVATYEKAAGRSLEHLDFHEVWAAVRLSIIMHRAGNLMIEIGLLPPDAPMKFNNPASQLLARLIGAPAPGGDAQSFIGNR